MNLPNDKHLVNELVHMAGHVLGTGKIFIDPEFFTTDQWVAFAGRLRSYLGGLEASSPVDPGVGDLVEALGRWGDWRLCEVEAVDCQNGEPMARIVTLEGEKLVALIDLVHPDNWRFSEVKKCLVRGCKNRSDQGIFRGNTCSPCASFLAGRGDRANSSQAYRNHVAFARETHLQVSAAAFDQLASQRKP